MPVYFLQAGEDGPIKIGHATDVSRRVREIQVNCPERLRSLGMIPGDRITERELHRRFSADRVSGEWFRPSAALAEIIKAAIPILPPIRPFQRPAGRQWTVSEIIACAGGVSRLAQLIGVDHSSVCDYRRWERIPVARARTIHEKLGVPLHEIRGDAWSEADNAASTDHAAD